MTDRFRPAHGREIEYVQIPDLQKLPSDALLTRKQVCAISGYAIITLKKWAGMGRGPSVTRVEGNPRYRVADVRSWLSGSSEGAQ